MPFSLLHTADLHLGKAFGELPPELAARRHADLLATLERLCTTARERQVQLLVIAGDLFDRPAPPAALLAQVKALLGGAGVPVLVIPGNHDPLEAHSPYGDARWPGNVTVARTPGWQPFAFDGQPVWAFGYTAADAHTSPWATLPSLEPGALLALHAACMAPTLGDDGRYYRFTPGEIPACAYLALGHHHRQAQVSRAPLAWYPGSPEPLEAQEAPGSALLVTLDGAATVEAVPVGGRQHRLLTLDVSGLSADEIYARAQAATTADDLLQVRLTGLLEPTETLDTEDLATVLRGRAFYATVDDRGLLLPLGEDDAGGVRAVLRDIATEALAGLAPDDPLRARYARAARVARMALEGKLG